MPEPTPPSDARPTWPLPALQHLATQRLVILRTADCLELLAAAEALDRPRAQPQATVAEACALARALVAALSPEAFLGSDRAGGEARDRYRVTLRGRARAIGLTVFTFPGQPEIALFELLPDSA
jgi:hypothetical protein